MQNAPCLSHVYRKHGKVCRSFFLFFYFLVRGVFFRFSLPFLYVCKRKGWAFKKVFSLYIDRYSPLISYGFCLTLGWNNTGLRNQRVEGLRRGAISGCSFFSSFSPVKVWVWQNSIKRVGWQVTRKKKATETEKIVFFNFFLSTRVRARVCVCVCVCVRVTDKGTDDQGFRWHEQRLQLIYWLRYKFKDIAIYFWQF